MIDATEQLLNSGLASAPSNPQPRNLTILNISSKPVNSATKVEFSTVESSTGKEFKISDVWIKSAGSEEVKGLWYTPGEEIKPFSALGRLMQFHGVSTVGELLNKDVPAFPDKNNFLVLTTYDKKA
jgi:hypothetical protein